MALRNSKPLKWRPRGVSDAVDGSNAFPGAMTALSNLVPSPTMAAAFVPRAASLPLTTFPGFTSPAQINAELQVGPIVYGMIAETAGPFAGLDVPFVYNVVTGLFSTVVIPGGAASLPTTPAAVGDWTPPTMAVVASRVMVTHPGFPGGAGPFFGWIDISSFTDATVTGSTHTNTTIDTLSANVLQNGWQVGQAIAGAGIPANTTITAINVSALDLNTTATQNGTTVLSAVASVTGVVPGSTVSGIGIQPGTVVVSSPGGGVVNLSLPTITTGTAIGVNFSGGTSLTLSKAATATANTVGLTVTGGTPAAPLWGSGNLNTNPLLAVPVAVAQFNARAYFAVGNGMTFSDAGTPTQRTSAFQAITFGNGLAVTALGGTSLSQTLGGMLQALIAFQGDNTMQQITGDVAFGNLSVNELSVGVGTNAPNTICSTAKGLAFIAPDGLRLLEFTGVVSEPVGADGEGVCYPFLSAVFPTRMAAAFNQNVFRVSVQNGAVPGQPFQEWWYDFKLKVWTGPHSFPAALIVPFQGTADQGFTVVPVGVPAALFSSSVTPSIQDTYVENGTQLAFVFETVLLPDNDEMAQNSMTQTTLSCAIGRNQTLTVVASDEEGNALDQVFLFGPMIPDTIWGSFAWGASPWGGIGSFFVQNPLPWDHALVFKQARLQVTGNSVLGTVLSNINMQVAKLGYLTQFPQIQPTAIPPPAERVLVTDSGIVEVDDGGVIILMSDP